MRTTLTSQAALSAEPFRSTMELQIVMDIPMAARKQITEKIQSTQQGHKKSRNVGTRLVSGFFVSFASGVVEWNCWMKQQSNTQKQGALTAIQTGCLGALHGSQSLTALNR